MAGALQLGGAVHDRRLVELRVDPGERRQVDDRPPAGVLPDAGKHVDGLKQLGSAHERDPLQSEPVQRVVDHPGVQRQEAHDHARHHHGGDEVGSVSGQLHRLPEAAMLDVVQSQREDDRDRERGGDLVGGQPEGIPEHRPELRRLEEAVEVGHADPGAAEDALHGEEIAERDLRPPHRHVLEDQQVDQRQQQQQVQLPVDARVAQQRTPRPRRGQGVGGRPRRPRILPHPPLPGKERLRLRARILKHDERLGVQGSRHGCSAKLTAAPRKVRTGEAVMNRSEART